MGEMGDQITRSQAELSSGDARKFAVPVHFTTKNPPKSEQFEAWRDTCEVVADISPLQCPSDGFEVEHQFWDVGNLLLSRTSAPSVNFVREARCLKKYSVDHWILSYSM